MINWKVRVKNKLFWLSIVPAALLLAQAVGGVLGLHWDFAALGERLGALVEALFAVLALLGVVTDPTTAGVQDSSQAMTYEEPKAKSSGS